MPVAAPTGKLQGFKSTFHYTISGGASVKLKSISEWKVDITAAEIDVSDHDTSGWKDFLTGMAQWKATVKMVYFEGDTSQQGLLTALATALVSTTGNLLCTFEPIDAAGGEYYSGTAQLTSYSHSAGNNDAQMLDISLSGRGPLQQLTQVTAN